MEFGVLPLSFNRVSNVIRRSLPGFGSDLTTVPEWLISLSSFLSIPGKEIKRKKESHFKESGYDYSLKMATSSDPYLVIATSRQCHEFLKL